MTQPDFQTLYTAAKTRAAAAFGLPEDHRDVINTAAAVARLEEAEAEMGTTSTAREQADRAATDQLLARLRATAPEAEAAADADPAPDQMQNALSAAVAGINARRGVTPAKTEDAAPASGNRAGEHSGAKGSDMQASSAEAQAAFAKAAARLNANR